MNFFGLRFFTLTGANHRQSWRRIVASCLLTLIAAFSCLLLLGTPPALAGIDDDQFDGNVFLLYSGNASLVPPRETLAEALNRKKPALLVFYLDDSRDCKQYASVVSNLQFFYRRVASLIPVNVDAMPRKSSYTAKEPGYYYEGVVPQTVLIDQTGKVVLNEKGNVPFERIDDVFRQVFNLLPREESVELKRRPFNEFNGELAK